MNKSIGTGPEPVEITEGNLLYESNGLPTPTPWFAAKNNSWIYAEPPGTVGQVIVAWDTPVKRANVQRIVEAVNSYDSLKAENERLKTALKDTFTAFDEVLECIENNVQSAMPRASRVAYTSKVREMIAPMRAALSGTPSPAEEKESPAASKGGEE